MSHRPWGGSVLPGASVGTRLATIVWSKGVTAMASQDAWSGWIVFAAFVIIIVGGMDILQGFVAILEDEYVVATPKGTRDLRRDRLGLDHAPLGRRPHPRRARLARVGPAGHAGSPSSASAINAFQQVAFLANYPAGVSPLEHPDRHAELRRALCADRALAGLSAIRQGTRGLTGGTDRIEGARGPSSLLIRFAATERRFVMARTASTTPARLRSGQR